MEQLGEPKTPRYLSKAMMGTWIIYLKMIDLESSRGHQNIFWSVQLSHRGCSEIFYPSCVGDFVLFLFYIYLVFCGCCWLIVLRVELGSFVLRKFLF